MHWWKYCYETNCHSIQGILSMVKTLIFMVTMRRDSNPSKTTIVTVLTQCAAHLAWSWPRPRRASCAGCRLCPRAGSPPPCPAQTPSAAPRATPRSCARARWRPAARCASWWFCARLVCWGDVATAEYPSRLQSTHKNNFVHHITCHCERCSSCHMQVLTEILANGIIWQIKKGNDFWRATSVTIEASASVTMSHHHEVVPHSRGTRGC